MLYSKIRSFLGFCGLLFGFMSADCLYNPSLELLITPQYVPAPPVVVYVLGVIWLIAPLVMCGAMVYGHEIKWCNLLSLIVCLGFFLFELVALPEWCANPYHNAFGQMDWFFIIFWRYFALAIAAIDTLWLYRKK